VKLHPVTEPIVGDLYAVTGARGVKPNVYAFLGERRDVDPIYRYALRLVAFDESHSKTLKVGDIMYVERAWFDVRGKMAVKSEGAVRRVA
jgi:hypothetical protein